MPRSVGPRRVLKAEAFGLHKSYARIHATQFSSTAGLEPTKHCDGGCARSTRGVNPWPLSRGPRTRSTISYAPSVARFERCCADIVAGIVRRTEQAGTATDETTQGLFEGIGTKATTALARWMSAARPRPAARPAAKPSSCSAARRAARRAAERGGQALPALARRGARGARGGGGAGRRQAQTRCARRWRWHR